MIKVTLGVFETHTDAESAINDLMSAGIAIEQISYIQHSAIKSVPVAIPEGVGTGATLGAFAGLTLTFLAMPAYPLIVAGPIVTLIGLGTGTALGAVTGGLIEALVKTGFSEETAKVIETKVEAGGSVVMVQDELDMSEVMRKNRADEVHVVEVKEDSVEVVG
jgi:hypothetical protein